MRYPKIIVLLYLLLSFIISRSQDVTVNNNRVTDTIGQLGRKELKLARELCVSGNFDFCSDGYEQMYRSSPAFVRLNFNTFINSYDNAVYMLMTPAVNQLLIKNGIEASGSFKLDSLFSGTALAFNTVSFTCDKAYQKKVNRMYKRASIKKHFDGVFNYALYRISFQYIYSGKKTLIIQSIDGKSKGIISDKLCDVYYITDIYAVQPISKEEYLK